ncbi:leukosialin [Eleutherodactylus coqui]|uniref:Uncharacterized protein n=1 Tax=Eleutherodactylus coqui TaxID=57060 RepID=A0A8J6BCS3_ELECQ|nr:hypothetical protein GDO78_018162 [Eleutherodactylus coqui]
MAGQLLRLSLLLMSLICSSAIDSTPGFVTNSTENVSSFVTNGPLFSALNEDNNNDTSTMGSTSAKESNVTSGQEASPANGTNQEETSTLTADGMTMRSTISKDPPPVNSTVIPYIDLNTHPEEVPFTSHEDNKTTNPKVTPPLHPPGNTVGNPELETKPNTTQPKSSNKDWQKVILILICIVILILILVTVVIFMVRNNRRRGSQSFSTRSRSSNRQDVWAGQVPELGDGKMTPHPAGMENGKPGNKAEPGTEQEMSTFISGEKKEDSVGETNELFKGEALDEKKPLLEQTSQVNEEAEKSPGEEEIPAPTKE